MADEPAPALPQWARGIIAVAEKLGPMILSIMAALFAGLSLLQSDGAKDKAASAEVRTHENTARIEKNEKELVTMKNPLYGAKKEP